MSRHFTKIAVIDTEYEIDDGGLPNLLCMVVYWLDANLRLVKVVRYWRGEFPTKSPFDDGVLVVAFSGWAELTCFMQPSPNWEFPRHIFDLHTAYLATSNILLPHDPDNKRKRERCNLAAACRAFGIAGWENINKPAIAEAIGQGRWREFGKDAVLNYCEEDVRNSTKLLRAMLRGYGRFPPVCVEHVYTGPTTVRNALPKFRLAACRSIWCCGTWSKSTKPPSSRIYCAALIRVGARMYRSTHQKVNGVMSDLRIGWRVRA